MYKPWADVVVVDLVVVVDVVVGVVVVISVVVVVVAGVVVVVVGSVREKKFKDFQPQIRSGTKNKQKKNKLQQTAF